VADGDGWLTETGGLMEMGGRQRWVVRRRWLADGNGWPEEMGGLTQIGGCRRWVAELVVSQAATAAVLVQIQTSLKNVKMGDISKGVSNTFLPGENTQTKKKNK